MTWAERPLGEVATLQRGFDLPSHQRRPGRVPIVSSSGHSDVHAEAKVAPPGVVTGRYGTIGQVFFVTEPFWPLNTTLYVRDFQGNDPRFVYYLLHSVDFESCNDKSGVPGVNRNDLHRLLVDVPPSIGEQRAIAEVLGALDDKIELNRQMNGTLEEMASGLFRSWFVDFDPVVAKAEGRRPFGMDAATAALFPAAFQSDPTWGDLPKGWTTDALDAIADFRNGLALQNFRPVPSEPRLPVIKIAQMRTGRPDSDEWSTADIDPSCILDDGDIVFSWSGSLAVVVWCGGRGALNQHLFKVTSAKFPKWFFHQWTLHHLPEFQGIAADKATTMGHIRRFHLTEARCVVPPAPVIAAANRQMAPWLDLYIQNALESRTLAALRDALLPKLLSGEVRLKQAESVVASAV